MSHTAQIQIKLQDLSSVKKAFEHLNWKVQEKGKIRTYPNDPAKNTEYDYVAINPNQGYDLGINRDNKEFKLLGDFYGGSIERTLGRNIDKFRQRYAFEVVKKYAEEADLEYEVNELENGVLELVINE